MPTKRSISNDRAIRILTRSTMALAFLMLTRAPGCTHVTPATQPTPDDGPAFGMPVYRTSLPVDPATADLLLHATAAQACLLSMHLEKIADGRTLVHYLPDGPAIDIPPAQAALLAALLIQPHSYVTSEFMCFEPVLQLTYSRGHQKSVVLICFHCMNLTIDTQDANNHSIGGGSGSFAPIYKLLAQLAKQLFPQDPTLQSLNENAGQAWVDQLTKEQTPPR